MGAKAKPDLSCSFYHARLSECGLYRYTLERGFEFDLFSEGAKTARIGWIMLNPSTADANQDDPTIRRCIGFSKAWGFGAMEILNLFAYRTPNPKVMKQAHAQGIDIVGPENDAWIETVADTCDVIVAAWGKDGSLMGRGDAVAARFPGIMCLGTNENGTPKHPLYLATETKLREFAP